MRALTLTLLRTDFLGVSDVPDPRPSGGELLVDGLAVGVCGTDKEIAAGDYGWAPPSRDRLESFTDAFTAQPDDVKVVITLDGSVSSSSGSPG